MNAWDFGPAFSPEGSEVAFAWDGEQQENIDIYVKRIGSPEIRRLTTDPEVDLAPQWSSEGTRIAFLRRETRTSYRIRLVSSVGGSDHALPVSETLSPTGPPRRLTRAATWGIQGTAWSQDGRDVIYSAPEGAFVTLWRVAADGSKPPVRIEGRP